MLTLYPARTGKDTPVTPITLDSASIDAATRVLSLVPTVGDPIAVALKDLAASTAAASTPITGASEDETAFDQSYEIPADTIAAGTEVRIRGCVRCTALEGSETTEFKVLIGAQELIATGSVSPGVDGLFVFDITLVGRAAPGATAACIAYGSYTVGAAGTDGPVVAEAGLSSGFTLATNGALAVTVANDWQASATDTNSVQLEHLAVEIRKP